ncbi:VacJ family lipoprotein [Sphingobium sufflavum]|uniref:MlaA family lipoprotein n=1 Tax=Sphingobium sufflavum TaxID=1129547 RepID=UPI001F3A3183|nr:VacJ family lipoprotein [Sphingobium sufflavum]MCE7797001.1 VacJ family lipoprotein [Sphingobium sufflavum]
MSVSSLALAIFLTGAQAAPNAVPATTPDTTSPAPVAPALPADAFAAGSTTVGGDGQQPPADSAQAASSDKPDLSDNDSIVVTARRKRLATPTDPLVGVNAASFEAIQAVDKLVVGPTAKSYEKIVPKPVRNGLRNVLINLAEPIVFVNFLLQFKPGKAFETVGRFAINSTVGVAGLFDMAKRKPFHLPYRQNGFANTFGYHGIGNGPFLFVPILGPTTARDLVGRILDLSLIPAVAGKPFNDPLYGLGTGTVKAMNDRVEFDEQIEVARDSDDPYTATREFYLKRRRAEINALHSPEYRRRKGIPDPVLPRIAPHVPNGAVPGSPAATPTTSIPNSTGMVPAAPAPETPVAGTPALAPAQ